MEKEIYISFLDEKRLLILLRFSSSIIERVIRGGKVENELASFCFSMFFPQEELACMFLVMCDTSSCAS